MKATEQKISEFLAQTKKRFVIPVYQRNYDWKKEQCKQLLDDIIKVGQEDGTHFIGSVVYIKEGLYTSANIEELMIVDGQQRITTLTLLYLALYRLAMENGNRGLADELYETYLVNKFDPDSEKVKLRTSEINLKPLLFLMGAAPLSECPETDSALVRNFQYIKGRVSQDNYKVIQKGLSNLVFVEVVLKRGEDDPQRIFESLNSTGLPLKDSDLIRNYLLMGLNSEDQERIYRDYWTVIEKNACVMSANKSQVSEFIRDFLVLEKKQDQKISKVYAGFKEKYPNTSVEAMESVLGRIRRFSGYYHKLLNPNNESDCEVKRELTNINSLKVTTAYPFLLAVFDDFARGEIDKAAFIGALNLLQSYAWRRIITGLGTTGLNKFFPALHNKINKRDYLNSLQLSLLREKAEAYRFPRNEEVKEALRVRDVYHIDSGNRRYLFEQLESFGTKEPVVVDGLTIEHIFPQNPDPAWKSMGEAEYNDFLTKYLDTLGNLTLTGYNSEYSNKPFAEKRDMEHGFKQSPVALNKYLASCERWDKKALDERFEILWERFVQIWPCPNIQISSQEEEVNVFDAVDPKGKALEYYVFLGERKACKNISNLYVEVIGKLFDEQPERFFAPDMEFLNIVPTGTGNSKLTYAKISDGWDICTNYGSNDKFKRLIKVLEALDMQGDLLIKYAENT